MKKKFKLKVLILWYSLLASSKLSLKMLARHISQRLRKGSLKIKYEWGCIKSNSNNNFSPCLHMS